MYNATVLSHFSNPYHQGVLPEADAVGEAGIEGEGPYMNLYLKMSQHNSFVIEEAWYSTYGCPGAIACGSWLCQWLEGKNTEEASRVEAQDIDLLVGGLPLGKEHCAQIAADALHFALLELNQS